MAAVSPREAAAEILRRDRAQESLIHFAQAIDIPGVPVSDDPDEALFKPVESTVALHHRIMMEAIQRTMETPRGRLMILAPPGSAKSSYASVVAPSWAMGKWPGYRIILASYATGIARKQSRRCRQICASPAYQSIWNPRTTLRHDSKAVEDWALNNGSEYMAAGLMAGITGNRANGVVIDDPVAGREEADSETIRQKTDDAYRDDLMTRLLPGGWVILIQTRWHEDDLAGRILPEDYDGRSGPVECRDGKTWYVLNMPAKCERADDPLGRELGEYLWPEWFTGRHFEDVERDPRSSRTWSALYQQRPVPDGGGDFTRGMFKWYDERPERLRFYGASDYAVTKKAGDFTEHGVFGMDEIGDLWGVAWWSGQDTPDVTVDAFLDLVEQYRTTSHGLPKWWTEGGVIDKAIRSQIDRRMRERKTYVSLDAVPSMADKRAKLQSFRARAAAGTVHLPRGQVWAERLVDQLVGFPAARYDDMADVCGLIGRGIDKMMEAEPPAPAEPGGIKPFTKEWLEYDETEDDRKPRYA